MHKESSMFAEKIKCIFSLAISSIKEISPSISQQFETVIFECPFFSRASNGDNRVCTLWRPAGIPEKEPWIKRHLLQRPRCQTANKFDVSTADEVCLANR